MRSNSWVPDVGRGAKAVRAQLPLTILVALLAWVCPVGCQAPPAPTPGEAFRAANERHLAQFADFELPRRIGSVENAGLQIPAMSPDGQQMLYLRTDQDRLSPMTQLGSASPEYTPPDGTLSVWLRPLEGTAPGRQLSRQRWAHSPVWSKSGGAVAYVVNEPPGSFITHVDLTTGAECVLGVPRAVNCTPRFDDDDQTVLFCGAASAAGPFRVYRQRLDEPEPVAMTPEGTECVLPVMSKGRRVLCARVEEDHLNWAWCGPDGITDVAVSCGLAEHSQLLQVWAGITSPLSPDGRSLAYYDSQQNRVGVCHLDTSRVVRHRPGTIAACWLTSNAIALATADDVFVVQTETGMSPVLFDGQWIPCRYVASQRRLLLLRRESGRRFSIVEVIFKPKTHQPPGAQSP